jgi:predicted phosphoadenosine phosphosulfate sulfurtransferase
VGDVYKKELRAYLEIVHQIMTVDIKEAFPWLCIPLIVENEISPLGATWYQKREVELNDGVYTFKDEDDSVHEFASTREFLENFEPVKKGGKTITTGSGKYAVAETIQDDYDY